MSNHYRHFLLGQVNQASRCEGDGVGGIQTSEISKVKNSIWNKSLIHCLFACIPCPYPKKNVFRKPQTCVYGGRDGVEEEGR